MKEENNILALVVVGYESDIPTFKEELCLKPFFKKECFNEIKTIGEISAPDGVDIEVAVSTENNKNLSIKYFMLEKKLIVEQKNYAIDSINYDDTILPIIKSLLTMTRPASIKGFGINYSTDIKKEDKLHLFNTCIEEKLGKPFWDSNIGFKTELAFQNNDYTSVYRIFKNEKLSNNGERCYSFNVNFDFKMDSDNNAEKIVNIFKNNEEYYNIYRETIQKILSL